MASGTYKQSVEGTKLHKVVSEKVWTTDPANYVLTYCFLGEGSEASVEFALQSQHETILDSKIQSRSDFNDWETSQEEDLEV